MTNRTKIPRCEYCRLVKDLQIVSITNSVCVTICSDCYKVIKQVSKYPRIEIQLLKGGGEQ